MIRSKGMNRMSARVPLRRLGEITGRREESRPTAAERGYGRRWQRYARRFLDDNPLCVRCLAMNRTEPARCVDHIEPVTDASDPLFWDPTNHQALCLSCHSVKTMTEDRSKGRRRS